MNQRNNNQTDKYSDMLKWLSDKIKYTKNGRMYEDYYKVSEEYQKDKESNNSYLFKTIFYLAATIGLIWGGSSLWAIQEKILGLGVYLASAAFTLVTISVGTIYYNENKKHRYNKRLISRIYNSFKKECSRDPSIMSQYKKDKEEAKKKAEEPFDTEEFLKSFETESKPKENNQPKKIALYINPKIVYLIQISMNQTHHLLKLNLMNIEEDNYLSSFFI